MYAPLKPAYNRPIEDKNSYVSMVYGISGYFLVNTPSSGLILAPFHED